MTVPLPDGRPDLEVPDPPDGLADLACDTLDGLADFECPADFEFSAVT